MEQLIVRWRQLSSRSWFWWSLLLLPLLAIAAWVFFRMFLYESEIARMRTQVELDEERKKNVEVERQIELIDNNKAALTKEIWTLETKIRDERKKLGEVERAYQERLTAIDGIDSWDKLFSQWDK